MTLVLALEGREGLLLAADSRGTIGDPRGLTAISDDHIKIKLFQLSKYCGVIIAGASELAATLIDELRTKINEASAEYTDQIMNITRDLARSRYQDWFSRVSEERKQVLNFIVSGYDQEIGSNNLRPRIWLLSSALDFAPQLCQTGRMMAGVPQYATYLVHRLYNREMNAIEMQRLAAYLISETATQDPKVGGPIRMASITPDVGFAEVDQSRIDDVVEEVGALNEALRSVFFKRKRRRKKE